MVTNVCIEARVDNRAAEPCIERTIELYYIVLL